jgi:hypothetical protein
VALAMAMDIISQTIKRVLANLPKAVSEIPKKNGCYGNGMAFYTFFKQFLGGTYLANLKYAPFVIKVLLIQYVSFIKLVIFRYSLSPSCIFYSAFK